MTKLADSLAALREPEYLKLFLGQATSVIGSMFRIVALPFAVLAIGGSATDIGIVEAAGLIPLTLLVLFGGVWADRLPRRTVMLVADAVRTVLQLTAAALLVAGVAEVWQLAALQVGMGVCEAFFWPAYTGLVPEVVSPPRLQQANALQGLVSSGSVTLGAVLAGMLVAAIGPGWALGVDGLSYLVSAGFLLRLRPAGYLGRRAAKRSPGAPDRVIAREEADADEPDQDEAHSSVPRPRRGLARVHRPHLDLGHDSRLGAVSLRHRRADTGARPRRGARRLRRGPHLGLHVGGHGPRPDRGRPARAELAATAADPRDRRRHERDVGARGASLRWRRRSGRSTRPWSPWASSGVSTSPSG